jgi:hypothetical protein
MKDNMTEHSNIQGLHKRMVRCGGYLCVNRTILLCMPCILCLCRICVHTSTNLHTWLDPRKELTEISFCHVHWLQGSNSLLRHCIFNLISLWTSIVRSRNAYLLHVTYTQYNREMSLQTTSCYTKPVATLRHNHRFSKHCTRIVNGKGFSRSRVKVRVRVKVTLEQAMKAQKGSRVIALLRLTSLQDGGGWSTPRPGRFTPGKKTSYPLYRRLGGPQGRSGRVLKISPPPGSDPRQGKEFFLKS